MGMRVEGLQINGKVYLFLFWEGAKMFGGSRSRVVRLGLNLGNFISVLSSSCHFPFLFVLREPVHW